MTMTIVDETSLARLVHWLAWVLLHAVWQGAVMAVLLWLMMRVVGATASSVRYGLACATMLMIALAPVATGFVLRDQLRSEAPNITLLLVPPTTDELQSVDVRMATPTRSPSINANQQPTDKPIAAFAIRADILASLQAFRGFIDRHAGFLVALWMLGVAFCAGRSLSSLLAVRVLQKSGVPILDVRLLQAFSSLIQRMNLDHGIRLMQSTAVCVPTVVGWLRPVVLFPIACSSGLSFDQIEALLVHELAHIKRHDYLVNLLQTAVEAMLFYHPAVWWVSNIIRNEREHCCDAIALRLVVDRNFYATTLFELARLTVTPTALSMSASGGSLKGRIYRILNARSSDSATSAPALVLMAILMFATTLAVSYVVKAQAQDSKAKDVAVKKNSAENGDGPSTDPTAPTPIIENNSGDKLRPYKLSFAVAKHVVVHDGRVVTWEEVKEILETAAAKHGKISPSFWMTTGGALRRKEFNDHLHKVCQRLEDAKQMDGHSEGMLSPRAIARYDRILDAADFVSDESSKITGTVINVHDKPVKDVEVFLLPTGKHVDAYLQDGRNREPIAEHLVRTDDSGRFEMFAEADEVYIAAAHPQGFCITTLENLNADSTLVLQEWGRIHGDVLIDDENVQSVDFTCKPFGDVTFHIYETTIAKEGSFDQRFLPPGEVVVMRGLKSGSAMMSFSVGRRTLIPGGSEEVILGPVPEENKKMLQHRIDELEALPLNQP